VTQQAIDLISLVIDNKKTLLPDADKVGRIFGGGENGHVIHYWKDRTEVQLIDQKWNNNHTPLLDDYVRHYSAGGPMRKLYCMDEASSCAWKSLMVETYIHKILRKLGIMKPYHLVEQPDLEKLAGEMVR